MSEMFGEEEIAVYLEELDEKIQVINDSILSLEREGGSPEIIQEIFRAAHTIKGSSAMMGYEKMSAFTHRMESLFDRLRQGEIEITQPLIDVFFEALDTLKMLKDEITGDLSQPVDIEALVERMRGFCESPGAEAAGTDKKQVPLQFLRPESEGKDSSASAEKDASKAGDEEGSGMENEEFVIDDVEEFVIQEAYTRGYNAYRFDIGIDSACQMKSVRAFLIVEALQRLGEIVKSIPPSDELQDGRFGKGFTILLLTAEDPLFVKKEIFSIAEVNSVEVTPLKERLEDHAQKAVTVNDASQKKKGEGEGAKEDAKAGKQTVKTVRVDVQKLDALMNLVGELVIDRTRLDRFVDIFENRFGVDELAENLVEISNHLGQVTNDLQEEIMKARMLPIANIFNRLPRMVRDMAHKVGKEINFVMEGRETELDRNVIEVIGDPLIHLLRNAVDHGIEPPGDREAAGKPKVGTIFLKAGYSEGNIVITLEDDGRGIDVENLRRKIVAKGLMTREAAERASNREILDSIFISGFSTASTVSDISGRGVGMDIVRSQIEQINGTVEYTTTPGSGTTFTIKLPLTLAIVKALMVYLNNRIYAFPLSNVVETIALKQTDIRSVRHNEVVMVRGHVLPLVRLSNLFGEEVGTREARRLFIVIVGLGDRKVGVVVDRLIGEQEIVIKSFGDYLGQVDGLSGATILGDGRVALIIDVKSIIKEASVEEVLYASN